MCLCVYTCVYSDTYVHVLLLLYMLSNSLGHEHRRGVYMCLFCICLASHLHSLWEAFVRQQFSSWVGRNQCLCSGCKCLHCHLTYVPYVHIHTHIQIDVCHIYMYIIHTYAYIVYIMLCIMPLIIPTCMCRDTMLPTPS